MPPSCQINGYTYCGCTVCGEVLYYDLLPMMPHALGEDGCCALCGEAYYVQLMVGEVYVTYENYRDILGDGTASYDPATNTLTLKNFYYDGELPGVYSQIPLNIVLEGDNYIGVSSPYNSGFCFDSVGGDFTVSGTGSLTVVSAASAIYTENYGDTTLTLGGDISITAFTEDTAAIYLYSDNTDLVIGDNVRLTLGTGENPICADAVYMNGETSGSATITDNACVNICTYNGDGIYVDNMTFHFWFNTYHYMDDEVTIIPMLGHADMDKLENGTFWIQYNNIAAKEIDDTIYVAATYEVDGVTYCTGVIPYSISTYCRNNAEGAMGDLAYATAVYGYYADNYFA